jgi:PAS domain S-box-containing protein
MEQAMASDVMKIQVRKTSVKFFGWGFIAAATLLIWQTPHSLSASAQTPEKAARPKGVLALYWYGKDLQSNITLDKSIQESLSAAPAGSIEYYAEYLADDRFPGETQSQLFRDYLRQKYADNRIDVIIAISSPALNFLLKYRNDLFPNTPIVFHTTSRQQASKLTEAGLTGVVVENAFRNTVDLALKLQPATEQALIITGTPERDGKLEAEVRQELKEFESRIKLTYLTDLPLDKLITEVKSASPRSIILYVRYSHDDHDKTLNPFNVLTLIAHSAKVPTYTAAVSLLGHGSIGGYAAGLEDCASKATELALRITNGARPQDISVVSVPTVPIFDWRQLHRWKISENRLPPGSNVQYKEPTFWEQRKWLIGTFISLFVVIGFMIVGLLLQQARGARIEVAMAEKELRLREAQTIAHLGSFHWDVGANTVSWSDQLYRIYGLEPGESSVTYETYLKRVHPDYRDQVRGAVERSLTTRKPFDHEYRIVRANGDTRWVFARCRPVVDDDGKVVALQGVCQDITERKQAEAALRESEERFSKAFHSSPQPMSITTLEEGRYVDVNDRFLETSGYTREEVIGHTSLELNVWETPAARDKIINPLREGQSVRNTETKFGTKSGEFRLFLSSAELVDLSGQPCVLMASSDITDRKRAEAAHLMRAALRADVSAALTEHEGTLHSTLQKTAEALVRHLDAALACIWTLNPKESLLELQASAGLYRRLNGAHARVPLGKLKIGLIAAERQPHLTNDVRNDLRISDPNWAADQGMVAFAGYPLLVEDRLIGVMAMFARHPLSEDVLEALATIAAPIAQGIERKRAEQALRESDERFRSAFDHAAIGMALVASDTRPLKVNHSLCELLGYSEQELLGATFQSLTHPDDLDSSIAHVRRVLAGEAQAFQMEKRYIHKRGHPVWVILSASLLRDGDGRPLYLISQVQDITERKLAEEALRESEERARRALVEQMLAGVAECDPDGKFVLVNQRYCDITGYGEAELLSMRLVDILHPDDLLRVTELNRRLVEAGEGFITEKRFRRKDGAEVWVNSHVSPVRNAQGAIDKRVSVVIDVTDRKRVEREREQLLKQEKAARAEAQAANQSKDEFLTLISHELRSPLNSILGYARLLGAGAGAGAMDAAQIKHMVGIIENSGKMQLQLIEDLLDIARIIRGKIKLELRPVELASLITAALDVARPAAKAKDIELIPDLDLRVGQIMGDPERLSQIIWNLLSNAIKFTPRSGRVELRMETMDHHVRIRISDTGKGIEPEFMPFIFDRFRQSDSSSARRFGGLGLGLSLAKQLVELHGGTIEAASDGPGLGATFTLTLPQNFTQIETVTEPQAIAAAAIEVKTEDAIPFDHVPSLAGSRVLVVDDQEEARTLLMAILGGHGAQVTAVSSGDEALAVLTDPPDGDPPDVLILDIAMPDENGYQVLERVRAFEVECGIPPLMQIPAIALTAHARAEDRLKALAAGFRMHVAKPVEPAELAMVIATLTKRVSVGSSA